jgi:hypothetical protein
MKGFTFFISREERNEAIGTTSSSRNTDNTGGSAWVAELLRYPRTPGPGQKEKHTGRDVAKSLLDRVTPCPLPGFGLSSRDLHAHGVHGGTERFSPTVGNGPCRREGNGREVTDRILHPHTMGLVQLRRNNYQKDTRTATRN